MTFRVNHDQIKAIIQNFPAIICYYQLSSESDRIQSCQKRFISIPTPSKGVVNISQHFWVSTLGLCKLRTSY